MMVVSSTLYWWMLPLSVFIAICANLTGIGGAAVFGPIFLIIMPLLGPEYPALTPAQSVATAVTVEIFGFSSGVFGYARRGLIDPYLSCRFFLSAVPMAIIASLWVRLPVLGLKLLYSVVMLLLSAYMLYTSGVADPVDPGATGAVGSSDAPVDLIPELELNPQRQASSGSGDVTNNPLTLAAGAGARAFDVGSVSPPREAAAAGPKPPLTHLVEWLSGPNPNPDPNPKRLVERLSGKVHVYSLGPMCAPINVMLGAAGGLMIGLIGVGLGEVTVPRLAYCRVPIEVASAASVLSVAFTCVVTACVQMALLSRQGGEDAIPWLLIAWMVPGVVVGAQIGTHLQGRLGDRKRMIRMIGFFFGVVGVLFAAVVAKTEHAAA